MRIGRAGFEYPEPASDEESAYRREELWARSLPSRRLQLNVNGLPPNLLFQHPGPVHSSSSRYEPVKRIMFGGENGEHLQHLIAMAVGCFDAGHPGSLFGQFTHVRFTYARGHGPRPTQIIGGNDRNRFSREYACVIDGPGGERIIRIDVAIENPRLLRLHALKVSMMPIRSFLRS